eukprot:12423803-Karenia_brevis.AAC.1
MCIRDRPSEEVEPTVEQISAVAQVVGADLVPYADFALFGPHGRRLLQKLMYVVWTFNPDGSWHRRELPGPPTFDHWWASYRVLKITYLLLDVAPSEILDNYGEMVRGFNSLYGQAAWFIIYTADVRMRSEQFERLRRQAERNHALAMAMGQKSPFDPAKPWYETFKLAIGDKDWWDENLHRPAMLYLTRVRSAADVVDDRTTQPALDGYSSGSQAGVGNHQEYFGENRTKKSKRSHSPRGQQGSHQLVDDPVYSKRGQKFCENFNSAQGCNLPQRSCKDLHACKRCKRLGHGQHQCVPPAPAPPADPRLGGKGSKRKGKAGH